MHYELCCQHRRGASRIKKKIGMSPKRRKRNLRRRKEEENRLEGGERRKLSVTHLTLSHGGFVFNHHTRKERMMNLFSCYRHI
jgi:hypothetical protein